MDYQHSNLFSIFSLLLEDHGPPHATTTFNRRGTNVARGALTCTDLCDIPGDAELDLGVLVAGAVAVDERVHHLLGGLPVHPGETVGHHHGRQRLRSHHHNTHRPE